MRSGRRHTRMATGKPGQIPSFRLGGEAMTSLGTARAAFVQPAVGTVQRLLIVDDEPGIRAFVGRALNAAGYSTDCVATGAEALSQAATGHYDLIILDLVMPDMSGQECLDQ